MKKIISSLCISMFIVLKSMSYTPIITIDAIDLPLYKESDHFMVYCKETDYDAADEAIKLNEEHFTKLSHTFGHNYSNKIPIAIYPDITSFHKALNEPEAADWLAGFADVNIVMTVSPNNPGTVHSYESIINGYKVDLITLFIYDKYTNHEAIPRWLHQGVALYKSNYYQEDWLLTTFAKKNKSFPTIEQLELVAKENDNEFAAINGFLASSLLVSFIETHWGWSVVMELMKDYSQLEALLKISKTELHNLIIQTIETYKK